MKFKSIMLSLIMLASCSAEPAMARGGSFSTSYGSRSSSYSSSRSYSAPRPAPTVTKNVTVNKTTVVHEHYNNGGSGNGMLTGMLLGEALSNHSQPQVVVQQPVPVMAPIPQQVVEQQTQPQVIIEKERVPENDSHWFLWLLAITGFGFGVYHFTKKRTA